MATAQMTVETVGRPDAAALPASLGAPLFEALLAAVRRDLGDPRIRARADELRREAADDRQD